MESEKDMFSSNGDSDSNLSSHLNSGINNKFTPLSANIRKNNKAGKKYGGYNSLSNNTISLGNYYSNKNIYEDKEKKKNKDDVVINTKSNENFDTYKRLHEKILTDQEINEIYSYQMTNLKPTTDIFVEDVKNGGLSNSSDILYIDNPVSN